MLNRRALLRQGCKRIMQTDGGTNGQVMRIVFDAQHLLHTGQVNHLLKTAVLLCDPQTCIGAACHQLRFGKTRSQRQQLRQRFGQGVMRIQVVASCHPVCNRFDSFWSWVQVHGTCGIQNRPVTSASAQVARNGFHGFFAGDRAAIGSLVQVIQTHDKAGRAKTALRRMVIYQSLLHRVKLTIARQVGCRGDLQAVGRMRHAYATVDRMRAAAVRL